MWGSGTPRREFLHVDDLADACVFLMETAYDGPLSNIGTGEDLTIRELATIVIQAVGLDAELRFDTTRPDGTPRKLLDVGRLRAWAGRPRRRFARASAAPTPVFWRRCRDPDLTRISASWQRKVSS